MLNRLVLAVVMTCVAAGARADQVTDAATGLALDPPTGYTARQVPPGPGQGARFEVKRPADTDTGCQVAFAAAPQNGSLTQAQIDEMMQGAEWLDLARSSLARFYDIRSTRPFTAGRPRGVIFAGAFKPRPDVPARAQEIRTLFVIQETPRGRTTTVCVGERAGFDMREAEFLAIAAGIKAP